MRDTKEILEALLCSPALAGQLAGQFVAVSPIDGAFIADQDLPTLQELCQKNYGTIEMDFYLVTEDGEVLPVYTDALLAS